MTRSPRTSALARWVASIALAVAIARPAPASEPGLLAHWTFDGNSAADSSGNDLTLALHGPTDYVVGVRSSALLLGPTSWADNFAAAQLVPGSRSWSVGLWVRPSVVTPGLRMLLSWYRCGADPNCNHEDAALYWLGLEPDGRPFWYVRGDAAVEARVHGPDSLSVGTWRHLAGTFDAGTQTLRMYVDGQFAESAEAAIGPLSGAPSIPISIGRTYRTGWGLPGEYFQGALDDVRIYERALSPAEVQALATVGTTAARAMDEPRALLAPAEPNPFRQETRIAFRLRAPADVRLSVHDVAGREIARLVQGGYPAGEHVARWAGDDDHGRRARAGVYFVRLAASPRDGGPVERQVSRVLMVR